MVKHLHAHRHTPSDILYRGTHMKDREWVLGCIILPLVCTMSCKCVAGTNDNRMQLASNGSTAHINLPQHGVSDDLTPSTRTELIIAHCSLRCHKHIVKQRHAI